MAKKLPLKVDKLEKLTSKQYIKLLNRMLKFIPDGVQTEFILVTNHVFSDLGENKSERIPLLLPGKMPTEWKKFFKERKSDAKQKKFVSKGRLTIREDKDAMGKLKGRKVLLEIDEGNKRVKQKKQQYLGKVLQRLKHTLEIEGAAGGQIDEKLNATKAAANKVANRESKEAMHEAKSDAQMSRLKEELRAQKKAMNEKTTNFWTAVKEVNNRVIKKLKNGKPTKRKDLNLIKEAFAAMRDFANEYDNAHKRIKKDFQSKYEKIKKQAKQMHALGKKAKGAKKSLAQELADSYFMKKKDRAAKQKEIKVMQNSLKEAIKYRNINKLDKSERKVNLKAVYHTARHRGPKFKPQDTDVVLQALSK